MTSGTSRPGREIAPSPPITSYPSRDATRRSALAYLAGLTGASITEDLALAAPEDLLHAVGCGVDLFDCVLPTRSARTGKVFTTRGDLVIKNARFSDDEAPLDPDCSCPTCARYSRAALRHLFVAREVTSVVLLTVHNLHFFLTLMREARAAIMAGRYSRFRSRVESARGSVREGAEADEER